MRFYLDTNILAYLLRKERDEICSDAWAILSDYENVMLTSTVCVQELIHLFQIGKTSLIGKNKGTDFSRVTDWLDELGVGIVPVSVPHLRELGRLPLFADYRDPNDRLIVAQAISDHVPLISSDRKFDRYRHHGLDFVYNER